MSIIISGIRAITGKASSSQRRIVQQEVSNLLNQNTGEIAELTKNSSKKQLSLLSLLANNFNRYNFYRSPASKESSKLVNEVFGKIKSPNKMHEYICRNFSESFENLNKIVGWTGDNKKRLGFVIQLNDEIFKHERPEGNTLIPDLLSSPYSEEYMKQYGKIKSYLKIYKNNPDAVTKLDKKFADGNFDGQHYDRMLENMKSRASFPFPEMVALKGNECYGLIKPENRNLAGLIADIFSPTVDMLKNGNAEDITHILSSTNKKNFQLREKLLYSFASTIKGSEQKLAKEGQKGHNLNLLSRLYNTLDNDKNAESFVKKSMGQIDSNTIDLGELVEILDNVSAKKLNIFKDNAWNIISKTHGEKRIEALNNNITDAFFETENSRINNRDQIRYGYKKRRTMFDKFCIRAKNGINKLRDAITPDAKPIVEAPLSQPVAAPKVALQPAPKTSLKPEVKPVVKQEVSKAKEQPAPVKIEKEVPSQGVAKVQTVLPKQVEKLSDKKAYEAPTLNVVSKSAKRQILKEKVVSFVKTKLGEKTFNHQQEDFSKNATQIRMSMLPEIFASIADTRKVDRMVGKMKSNSSNKDALVLYSKINGQNRKFVNYMLKKRNADNTRMFEVKDIIAVLNKAEARIANDKKFNSNYRAKDAKAYYNHLFDAKIEQYGKVKRQKVSSDKSK